LALVFAAGSSFAQGQPPVDDPDGENPLGTPEGTTEPVVYQPDPDPTPTPAPVVEEADPDDGVPDAVIEDSGSDGSGLRPDGWGFGIGIGYTFPADLDRINTTSVRFRFPSGFTIEPIAELSTDSDTTDFMGVDSDQTEFDFKLAALARFPILSSGKLDFNIIAGAGVTYSTDNPDGSDNDSRRFQISGIWGIAIDYWISQNWAFSLNAANPVFSVILDNQEQGVGDLETTNIELGAVFDPVVFAMLHLFF